MMKKSHSGSKLCWLRKTSLLVILLILLNAEAQERQPRSRQAEVSASNKVVAATGKIHFGDRKLPKIRHDEYVNFQPEDSIAAAAPNPKRKTSPSSSSSSSSSSIMQYEIPIVQKSQNSNNKGQKRPPAASAAAASTALHELPRQRTEVVTPRNWSRGRSRVAATAAATAAAADDAVVQPQQERRKQYLSSNLPRSSGPLTAKTRKYATTAKTTTSTTTTTTTTPRPSFFPNFSTDNRFNIFSPEFWSFLSPTTKAPATTTKKPPKKYTPTPNTANSHAAKAEKLTLQKAKETFKTKATPATTTTTTTTTTKTSTTTTTTTPKSPKENAKKPNDDGPFRIALPTFNFFNAESPQPTNKADSQKEKEKRASIASLRERFICPRESEVRFQLFPKICQTDRDCSVWNRDELCCDIFGAKSCVNGVHKPLEESSHAPILGLIQRKCPTRPLAELWWEVKECQTDMDCWPRVCCPDGRRRYCRTSQPELEMAPVPVRRSFDYLTEYLECTPPPPPIFDLHPKACTSTFDCFPNVCCQEAGLRHCRPPKKSVLTLMANFLNVDLVKRFTQNIVIK